MNTKSMLIGAAVAGLCLAGCTSMSNTATATVGQCHGVNACKGSGDCGGKGHACGGKNSCKGKGWKKMKKTACSDLGGKFVSKR